MASESSVQVLIIDDDSSFSDMTSMFLEEVSERIETVVADSGEEGFDLFMENELQVDAIVCDYEMPGWDGVDTLREFRSVSEVPFILFTGKGSEDVASEAISAGASDYLQKDGSRSTFEVLANRIVQYVEKQSLRNEAARVSREKDKMLDRVDDAYFSYDSDFRIMHLNKRGV